jgi:hypothetical protein
MSWPNKAATEWDALLVRVARLEQLVLPPLPAGKILWKAAMLKDLNEWGIGMGGGEFDSGSFNPILLGSFFGKQGAALSINGTGGVRLFRWLEPGLDSNGPVVGPGLYYSCWYRFPRAYTCNWSNIMQWKSQHPGMNSDPFLDLQFTSAGLLSLAAEPSGPHGDGPAIPIGQWFHLEAFYLSRGDSTGRVTVWLDGAQAFDWKNWQTRYPDGDTQWSVNNYGDGVQPSPCVIYVAEPAISTARIGVSA